MILLFGEKAKAHSTSKNSNIKNNPVENSGILASRQNNINSLLDMNEYDTYIFSQQAEIDYSMYASEGSYIADSGFMSSFANAVSVLSECGSYDSSFASFSSGCDCSCSSFSSTC